MPSNELTLHLSASDLIWLPPPDFYDGLFTSIGFRCPDLFQLAASDPDTLTFDEAMDDLDRPKWLEAAKKEI